MQTGGPAAYLTGRAKTPPPWPRSTDTCPANGLAPTRSSLPSPFRSEASRSSTGPASGKTAGGPNVPSPRPWRMATPVPRRNVAAARSSVPSPVRSAATIESGLSIARKLRLERNDPLPSPSSTVTKSSPKLARATSSWPSALKSPVAIPVGRSPARRPAAAHEAPAARAEEDAELVRQPGRRQDVEVAVPVQVGRRASHGSPPTR